MHGLVGRGGRAALRQGQPVVARAVRRGGPGSCTGALDSLQRPICRPNSCLQALPPPTHSHTALHWPTGTPDWTPSWWCLPRSHVPLFPPTPPIYPPKLLSTVPQQHTRAAVGDVAPEVVCLNLPQARKPLEHANLKLARVHPVVGLDERVPQVVDAVLLQALQRAVVKVQVVGVAAEQRPRVERSGSSAETRQAALQQEGR